MKSHPQKNTLLQAATSNAETKACKRVFFSPPQEKLKNKKFPTLQKNKTSFHRTVQTLTDIALNVNRLELSVCGLWTEPLRMNSMAAGNMVLANMAGDVQILSFVLLMNSSGRLNICASKPPHRQYPNRQTVQKPTLIV